MKFARYRHGRRRGYALVEDNVLRPIIGTPYGRWREGGEAIPLAEAKLLAPVRPSKVLGVALSYRSHVERSPLPGLNEEPKTPELFLMAPSARATGSRATSSGGGPRAAIPSRLWAPGWSPTSTPRSWSCALASTAARPSTPAPAA